MTLPGITKTKTHGNTAWYEIEPVEPGYGVTIAHAMKRILLSALPGAAVTSLRIEGVSGASQKIPHVQEDVMDVILNVKQLRLRSVADYPALLHLTMHGACEVTGADLWLPETVELLNPECHLATLEQENAHLTMELIVERGRGYHAVPLDQKPSLEADVIPIDAIYTPVRKANYTLAHTRVGKMVNFEKILLEIETDATMTPDEALSQSGEILRQQFLVLTHPESPQPDRREIVQSGTPIPQQIYDLPLEHLHLSVRSYNALKRNGQVTNVGQILIRDEEELRSIRNIGDKALLDIKDALQAAGCFLLLFESETIRPKAKEKRGA